MKNQSNNLQSELSEPQDALPPVSLDELPEVMQAAINRAGWTELTPVQSRAIPYLQARRDLMVQAPGTYHHSIIVGVMVEAAAEAIGANPLLAKASAHYHDIGKLKKPLYFVENQVSGHNKHEKLAPSMTGWSWPGGTGSARISLTLSSSTMAPALSLTSTRRPGRVRVRLTLKSRSKTTVIPDPNLKQRKLAWFF